MRGALICLAACAAAHKPIDPPPPVAAPVVARAPAAPPLDEAAVVARSHAFLDAFDRADVRAVADTLGPGFVWFQLGRFYDRASLANVVQSRVDRHEPVRSREWRDERVYLGEATATFV